MPDTGQEVLAATAAVFKSLQLTGGDTAGVIFVAASRIRTEKSHYRLPLPTMRAYPISIQDAGHHMGHFVGYRLGQKVALVFHQELVVVTDQRSPLPPEVSQPGATPLQVEADIDRWHGAGKVPARLPQESEGPVLDLIVERRLFDSWSVHGQSNDLYEILISTLYLMRKTA
jgi:hypothetical protein